MSKIMQKIDVEVSNISNSAELDVLIEKLNVFLENLYLTLDCEGSNFNFEIYPAIDNLTISGELTCDQKDQFATTKQYITQRIKRILNTSKQVEMKWAR